MDSASSAVDTAVELITAYGMSVLGAVVILFVGFWLSGKLAALTRTALDKAESIDAMLTGFFSQLVRWAVVIMTIIAVLNQFGVQTTSLIAVLGAAGLAIGLALQGTLSNIAAGVMLLMLRPFKVGDYVDAGGTAGTVKELSLFVCKLDTPDNVRITVPNSQLINAAISNYSYNETRRLDLVFGIGYDDDMDQAAKIIMDMAKKEKRVLKDPEPMVAVSELADSSVNLTFRFWCAKQDYWDLKFGFTRDVKLAFDAKGISIPYPQRDVHMIEAKPEPAPAPKKAAPKRSTAKKAPAKTKTDTPEEEVEAPTT
ncbi:MAG: mechanosensitive ion channel family protein [Magnetovibrionaceae bacterium]